MEEKKYGGLTLGELDKGYRTGGVVPDLIAEIRRLQQRDADLLATNNRLLEERRAATLVPFLIRKAEWSARTFGHGLRTKGICAHIRKELEEIEQAPLDLEEWIDVFMLATDGYWRAWQQKTWHRNGAEEMPNMALEFIAGICAKQEKNEKRTWPAPISEDLPVEHDRSGER